METKGRSFKALKDSMEEIKFQQLCKKIAEEYANSACEFARSYFLKQYGINQECYYKVLNTAVIEGIVDDDIVEKMELKALANQKAHAVNAGLSTRKHYNKLRRLRQENMEVSQFCDEQIKQWATEFAYSPLSISEFAKERNVTARIFSLLLEKAVEEVIVDDMIYQKLRNRSIAKASEANKKRTQNYFTMLTRRRNFNKRKLSSQ